MVTGGIHGTSREWFYDSLGLDSNSKSFTTRLPLFLSRFLFSRKFSFKIIINLCYKTSSNKNKILQRNIFFPYCKNKWNKFELGIRSAKSINIFKKYIVSKKKTHHFLFMIRSRKAPCAC